LGLRGLAGLSFLGVDLTLAIIGHLVGDYLLQNDWMALHKKRDAFRCSVHCWLWTLSVCFFTGWWSWGVVSVLFLSHMIQDHTGIVSRWMDLIGQHQYRTGPCAPWSVIVVDNVWHIVTLWAVWKFIA
jgi:hypothetical protein